MPPAGKVSEGHFGTCKHDKDCCQIPAHMPVRIGKKWASSLAGFIAGAIVTAVVLIPWMYVQGMFCAEADFLKVQPPFGEDTEAPLDPTQTP